MRTVLFGGGVEMTGVLGEREESVQASTDALNVP